MRVQRILICFVIFAATFGCGGSHRPVRQRVLLPPTLNLVPHHNIGLFLFSVENVRHFLLYFTVLAVFGVLAIFLGVYYYSGEQKQWWW